jgi:alpha-glucosidase
MTDLAFLGPLRAHGVEGRSLIMDFGGPRLAVTPLTDKLFRVRLAPAGAWAPRRSWDVARADDDFPSVPFAVAEQAGEVTLTTGALSVHVARHTGRVGFAAGPGRVFAADAAPLAWSAAGRVRVAKHIAGGERFYGFGERAGLLEKTGRRLVNWTTDPARAHGPDVDPMYIAIPIYLALRPGLAYGLFFHNTYRSVFDVGQTQPEVLALEAEGGEADYYVAFGPTPAEVLASWAALLGTAPLPPRWALGHHQSRWSYLTADEVRGVAAEFRRRDLACDALHLDIYYMRGYRVFTWDPVADLRQDGFRVVTIIDPGVKADPDYSVYQEGLDSEYFVRAADGTVAHGYVWPDDSVFPDFMRPEVRAWWGERQRALTAAGVSGVWNDMNEPVVFDRPFSAGGGGVGTLPLNAVQGPPGEQTTHAEVHNLYGLHMARASHEGLRQQLGDERPFTLTRSGYAGIQRWAACWMGDNNAWWEHLEMALPQLCNMGLSGVPFVGVDVGGFGDNGSAELLARWIQFGALMPFCRNHAAAGTARQEPWAFGPQVEAIYRTYLTLRYRLLPYLYSLFWEAARTGAPILRPLLYHFPNDPATYHLQDQVLLGPALLAAPILRPGQSARAVYLPAGEWFDWHSGEKFAGPGHILAPAPLEHMPLYARAGSVVPLGPVERNTDVAREAPLTLRVFPGDGEFALYEDDGRTWAYERGDWCLTRFVLRTTETGLRLSWSREGRYLPAARPLLIQVAGLGNLTLADDGQPRTITF